MRSSASKVTATVLLLIAAAHLLRLLFNIEIIAEGVVVPLWISVPAVIIPAGLALWLLKEKKH